MVGGTSNASGIIVYTLQQPRASEDIIALIQIKIQVNDPNMNGLFDSDSQYNIIFETLVDKFMYVTFIVFHGDHLPWLFVECEKLLQLSPNTKVGDWYIF